MKQLITKRSSVHIQKEISEFLILLVAVILISSCASVSKKIVSRGGEDIFVDSQKKIMLLPPLLRYEAIEDESSLDSARYGGQKILGILENAVSDAITAAGFDVM